MSRSAPVQPPRSWRGLVGVLSAYGATLSANRMISIAVPWFVLTTTGSAAKTGLIAFCQITPFVVVQILAGPLIDRIGARRISIAGDLVAMIAMTSIPLLHAAHALPLWALMALMALEGAADGPSSTAKSTFLPAAARAARTPLERGTGLITAVERTATTVGPAAAGVLVAVLGAANVLWFAAALFGLSAVIARVTLIDPAPDPAEQAAHETERYFSRLRQGAVFLRQEGLLRTIVGMLVATNLLDQSFFAVLLPVWARESGYGAQTVGLVISVFGATSIIAAIAAAGFSARLPRRATYLIGFVIGGIPRFPAMALGFPLWAVLAVFAVGGLGSGFINPVIGAVIYERIPPPLLGRVRTLMGGLEWSGIPFGGLFAAGLIVASGVTGALWIVGGCYLGAIIVPGLRPAWSQMRLPAPEAEAEVPPELARTDS
jgi:MFS family permease